MSTLEWQICRPQAPPECDPPWWADPFRNRFQNEACLSTDFVAHSNACSTSPTNMTPPRLMVRVVCFIAVLGLVAVVAGALPGLAQQLCVHIDAKRPGFSACTLPRRDKQSTCWFARRSGLGHRASEHGCQHAGDPICRRLTKTMICLPVLDAPTVQGQTMAQRPHSSKALGAQAYCRGANPLCFICDPLSPTAGCLVCQQSSILALNGTCGAPSPSGAQPAVQPSASVATERLLLR